MRSFLMVVAAAASFLAAGTPAVRAQGVFPLKYVLAEENDPLTSFGMGRSTNMGGRPPQFKALPGGLSGKVGYVAVTVGEKPVYAALDVTSPPKLYVDVARTGDLSAVTPLVGKAHGGECRYGPIDISTGSGEGVSIVKVRFVSRDNNELLGGRAAGYMAGDVKLDGQTCRAAVLDRYLYGRYDGAFGKDGIRNYGVIAIDSNQDGKFGDATGSEEIMPLSKAVCVKGKYYRVEVAPDGSSIKFEKYEPKLGTLDIGLAASLRLMSDTGVHNLSGADGKWQVLEGKYECEDLSVIKADAKGKAWTISGSAFGSLAKFEVRGGETTAIQIGPPLTLKVDADGTHSAGEIVLLNLILVGKAGETYSLDVCQSATQSTTPNVKVLDASGKLLAEGKSEFG